MAKKKGMESRRLAIDKRNENSRAPRLNRAFFCVMAANAESAADSKAIKNQVIYSVNDNL